MGSKSVRVNTLDTIFSRCVRESYDYVCQYPNCPECGNYSLRHGGLECSHYYGRRYRGGRWHPANCIALCHKIHAYIDTHHPHQVSLMRKHLGEGGHDLLLERMHQTFKYTPQDRYEMNAHYRDELKRLERERMNGAIGYLHLQAWD